MFICDGSDIFSHIHIHNKRERFKKYYFYEINALNIHFKRSIVFNVGSPTFSRAIITSAQRLHPDSRHNSHSHFHFRHYPHSHPCSSHRLHPHSDHQLHSRSDFIPAHKFCVTRDINQDISVSKCSLLRKLVPRIIVSNLDIF